MLNNRNDEWHKHLLREGDVPDHGSGKNKAAKITQSLKPRGNGRWKDEEQKDRQTDD